MFGQLHQQRAAASLSKHLKPILGDVGSPNYIKQLKEQSDLAKSLSLGYMSLISASDTFNQAKNAGYSDREAGVIALVSTGGLYGIMRYNESLNGFGTWMLDKTTGYHQEVNAGGMFKAFRPLWDDVANSMRNLDATGKKKIGSSFRKFLANLKYSTYGAWSGAIVEGTEEVTEEIIQDAVKGMADAAAYLGWMSKDASFGGFNNVFSKQGLERYLATFVGGAVGGALFDLQMNVLPGSDPNLRRVNKSLVQYALNGQTEQVIQEVKRYAKVLNTKRSPKLTKIGNEEITLSTSGQTQIDAVAETTIKMI